MVLLFLVYSSKGIVLYQETDDSLTRGLCPILPLLALCLDDQAFEDMNSLDQLKNPSPTLLASIEEHDGLLPLPFKDDILNTLLLRDVDYVALSGWTTSEERVLGYRQAAKDLERCCKLAGFIGKSFRCLPSSGRSLLNLSVLSSISPLGSPRARDVLFPSSPGHGLDERCGDERERLPDACWAQPGFVDVCRQYFHRPYVLDAWLS
jgi:hypothetical protein